MHAWLNGRLAALRRERRGLWPKIRRLLSRMGRALVDRARINTRTSRDGPIKGWPPSADGAVV